MTGRQVELRQIELLVQERVKELLLSKDIITVIVEAVTTAVTEAVVQELKDTISFNVEETKKLQENTSKLQDSIQSTKRELFQAQDELEQYQRRTNLRLFGIQEQARENTDDLVLDVVHNKLKLTHVTVDDIDRSHRVGVKKDGKPRPIIVKFVSYRKRNEVFKVKRLLVKSGITIREDLTSERLSLLNAAIQKYGINNVWTMDGKIAVKTETRRTYITTAEELRKVV